MRRLNSWILRATLVAAALPAAAHAGDWIGYMNWFTKQPDGTKGTYVQGSFWGVPALKTTLIATPGTGTNVINNSLELFPNYNTWNASDPYWVSGTVGNKWMEANTFVEKANLTESTVTFNGRVDAYTLSPDYTAEAFIKVLDPANGYSLSLFERLNLSGQTTFSLTADTFFYTGQLVQLGFMVSGVNANPANAATLGSVLVTTEPSSAPSGDLVFNVTTGSTQSQSQAGYASIPSATSVTKVGGGTIVFSGSNAYSGPTLVNAGTLQLANTAGLSATPVSVNSGATLAVAVAGTTGIPSIDVNAGGVLTLRNDVRQNVNVNSLSVAATVSLTVDQTAMSNGYMNWYELNGTYVTGSAWGVADLRATFTSGSSVTLAPCYVSDTSSYWYTPSGQPGATGNKTMEAIVYGQADGTYAGQTLKFSGNVADYTLLSGSGNWTVKAFVRDFAADYSSFVESVVPITTTGSFSVSYTAIDDASRHVQWGLVTTGPDVWITDLPSKGTVVVNAAPTSAEILGKVDIGKGRINIAPGGTTEADLRANLIAGRSGGTWSGTAGIVTTGGTAGLATQPVVGYRVLSSGSAIVAWAGFGDSNLDGQVNLTDVSLINNGGKFGQGASTGATWSQGDYNYSGGVTLTDISLLNNAALYNAGSYLPATGLGSLGLDMLGGAPVLVSVPEPGTWALALAGLSMVAAARSRSRRGTGGRP